MQINVINRETFEKVLLHSEVYVDLFIRICGCAIIL